MPNTQSAVNNHAYRSVPVAALIESASNPRKRFDDKSLEELAASFKTQGVLAPLLVRELEPSKFEVVAGARRLRAARIAELDSIPVRIVKLTDAEAIEAQVVENLQREDIHPLEEALGFNSLMQLGEPAYTIANIAARAGKSEAYVLRQDQAGRPDSACGRGLPERSDHDWPRSADREAPGFATTGSLRRRISWHVDERRQQPSPDSRSGTGRLDRVQHPAATGIRAL
jgi:ParB/RepB/Spo0J family partition protein